MNGIINPDKNSLNYIQKYVYSPNDENMKLTSIIMLTYNQLDFTKLCIESIRKFTPKKYYELIVVDNNSTDGTVDWLKEQEDIRVIYNDENKGFPAGCNQGINIANGDNILLLNNDTIVTPNWLNNLQTALYSNENVGAVGSISNSCSNYQQIEVNYTNIALMINFSEQNNISNELLWDERVKLIGYCYLIKKEVLDKVGLLDEIFSPGNYEDDDLSYRIINGGYKLLLCKDVFIHHFGSVSFRNEGNKFADVFYANQKKMEEKWGFNTVYSSNIRHDIITLLDDPPEKELNVLEVGCGIGASLLEIKNRYRNSNIYGIEISEGAGKIAQQVCDVIIGNIENLELPYKEEFFDYIIFGDVLEHLVNPWESLKRLIPYLKKDGFILASLPNIMNFNVLRHIINGGFTYTDAGILDKTHLRFFTLAEIQKLFDSINFDIITINGNGTYVSEEDEIFLNKLCTLSNENFKQQYMIYQYIIKAKAKLDLSRYENKELVDLKFKLLRIDNDLEVEESLDYIFSIYEKYKDEFINDIHYLVENNVVNKEKVINIIKSEAINRNLEELYSKLK